MSLSKLPIDERIGVSAHFLPATHGETIYDAIRLASEAGFAGFEIIPSLDQAQLGYPENHPNVGIDLVEATPAERKRLKQALKVFKWVTIHGPNLDWNLASANRHMRRMTEEYYDRCIDFAGELGAAAVTFHRGHATDGYIRDAQKLWQYDLAYARRAIKLARRVKVPIGYESGVIPPHQYVCERVGGWGINLDLGHAYMTVFSDENFFKFFDAFKGRIVEIHHNGVNQFWGKYMEHQPTHLNNMIDYQGTYERLREDGYAGPIICEIQGQDIPSMLRHSRESKEMICGIWNGTLKLKDRWYAGKP